MSGDYIPANQQAAIGIADAYLRAQGLITYTGLVNSLRAIAQSAGGTDEDAVVSRVLVLEVIRQATP